MDSKYNIALVEQRISDFWKKKRIFVAKIDPAKKPFSIILPPPNANADLHLGHAMYLYEDVMIRYHRLKGDETLWLAGADHAGFETQYVFEKHLQKQGKSRLDYDRKTLYQMIWDFVMKNKDKMENQLDRLGFALDWSKKKFTLDEDIIKIVYSTFKKLFDQKLVYREKKLVNYCTFCGTSFSDLEVVYKDRIDPLYYLKYGPFVLATTRPETKFGDTGVAVNPKDKRYQSWIGKEIEAEGLLGKFKIKVVADDVVDPKFGTGVVKVTPAHDFTDFEIGKRHQLAIRQVINFDGKLNEIAGNYAGLYINQARKKIAEDLQARGLIEKIKEDYQHRVGTCYKCGRVIEPLPLEQWFVKIRPLADQAEKLIINNEIKIYPKRFRKILINWLQNFHDWNISRQVVWGIRIPAYRCNSKLKTQMSNQWFVSVDKPEKCQICGNCNFEQDNDTFDTWFSSSQWPFATLLTQSSNEKLNDYYKYFYPTSVMETGYEILPWWVARMIMMGYFVTGKPPFYNVFLHGMVRDKFGRKMSKSKGNVINPLEIIDKYGADALRAALIFGLKEGNDVVVFEEKIIGMRNFVNKLWNMGRFINLNQPANPESGMKNTEKKVTSELNEELKKIKKNYQKLMDSYQFAKAFNQLYEFVWHRIADHYIEALKDDIINGNIEVSKQLQEAYLDCIKMLHPFIPFVTEGLWQVFKGDDESILYSSLATNYLLK